MAILKRVLLVLALVVIGFVAFAATRPSAYHVERSQKIDAPAIFVYAQLDDLKAWGAWSPWDKRDPGMKKTYEGPPRGVGASYAWQGNDKVGEGRMTIVQASPPTAIAYRLELIKPFPSVAATSFALKPEGDRSTTVTWAMDGSANLIGKMFSVFMNMDKMVGGDFETGLGALRTVAESKAKDGIAAPPPSSPTFPP